MIMILFRPLSVSVALHEMVGLKNETLNSTTKRPQELWESLLKYLDGPYEYRHLCF